MRIRKIAIRQWRHFVNLELQPDENAALVCIVGANGTGKSHLLELIATCAHRLGLSQGVEIPRGDPFADPHDFSLTFYLAEGVSSAVDEVVKQQDKFASWDRTLTIQSNRSLNHTALLIEAGGVTDDTQRAEFAKLVIEQLRRSHSVHFLALDADRAYPKRNIAIHEIAQAYETDWDGVEYTRGRSFKSTATLYDEWIKYFLAQENQAGTRLIRDIRRSRQTGAAEPNFSDHFDEYRTALQQVLPHVVFAGVDTKSRRLLFDTTGLELSFDQLSGGEREIAFLIGQIDRFSLRHGLFLIDEPELHLNADLIRMWVGYLTSTVRTGQVWLATHSLEAVEAAGQQATFVLERNEGTRKVDSLVRLDNRPVLSALSRAVGTPAFSISNLRFVFIEGEESVGERERFRQLAGLPQDVRFMECGSCNEVVRRVLAIKSLAKETQDAIRIGGVVDRDFRSDAEVQDLRTSGVYVLDVHEVENLFLHPDTMSTLAAQNGVEGSSAFDRIRAASDLRAGSWIYQYAMATRNATSMPVISVQAKERAKLLTWSEFECGNDVAIDTVVTVSGFDEEHQGKLRRLLHIAKDSYARKRVGETLWMVCEGKQVLKEVSRAIGFSGPSALSHAAFALWARDESQAPAELRELRSYLEAL